MRTSCLPWLSSVLALALASGQGPTAAGRPLEDVLPASTYACLSFAGTATCGAAARELDVGKLIDGFLRQVPKATLETRLEPRLAEIAQEIRQGLAGAGISPAVLRAVLRRPMALGLGRLTLRGFGPSLALVIDEGDAKADLEQLVGTLLQVATAAGFHAGQRTLDGRELRTLEHPQAPTVLFARDQGLFVVTNSEGYLREILATAAGKQPPLARQSALGVQRGRLPGSEVAGVFVNTQRVLAMFDDQLPYEAAEIGDALGMRSLAGVYAGCSHSGGVTSEVIDFALPGAATGLFKAAFADGGADLGAAAMCSKDTLAFASLHCNLPAALAACHRLVDLLPAGAAHEIRREFEREVRRALRGGGVTADEVHQLLAALGGSLSIGVSMGTGLKLPDVVLFVPVRDAQVVAPWIERLAGMAAQKHGIEWKTRQAGEHEIHYCEIATGMAALAPSYVLADGYLLLSTQTKSLVAALKQKDNRDGSLAAAPDFVAAQQGHAGAAGFLHLRSFRAVEFGWRPFEQNVLALLDRHADEVGFGREAVPDQEEFAKALGTTTISLTVDADGARLRSQGPIGFGGLLAGAAWLGDELLGRAAGRIY